MARMSVLIVCVFLSSSLVAANNAPNLSVDNTVASAGFYTLSWQSGEHGIELQESTTADFVYDKTIYTGHDSATVISGKPDGVWYYRIRYLDQTDSAPWSAALKVTVQHHSLTRAFLFLSLGIVIFVAIVFVIVRADRDDTA